MQQRRAIRPFPAFTLQLEKHTIPAGAMLEDYRTGRGHEGLQPENPQVASFHYEGRVYFNLHTEIAANVAAVQAKPVAQERL